MARSLCHYRRFNLTDIPLSRREQVLQLYIKQWSPFQNYGQYAVWQGNQIAVWIWDATVQQQALEEAGLKNAFVVPETVLHPRLPTEGVQLVHCLEGVEGQIWQHGGLKGSRWWPHAPKAEQWYHFQRAHSLAELHTLPTIIDSALLERPWGKPKTHLDQFLNIYQEQLWITLALAVFTLLLTWQAVSIWVWQQALHQVEIQTEQLRTQVAPIVAARTQALTTQQRLTQILALDAYPAQLTIMAQIAEHLPHKQARIVKWFYQLGELNFTVETPELDATLYVKTFQALPLFNAVKAETDSKKNQLTISMDVVTQ